MNDPTFVAFIDESGCDGDKFDKGSSSFLILSAAVGLDAMRSDIDLQVELVEGAIKKADTRKPDGWAVPKFEKANPTVKWAMCERFAETQFYCAHVLIHKPSIRSEALRKDRNRLYRYGSKLLLERISWICDALYHPMAGGDGSCDIVFSQDLSRSYDLFRDYMAHLYRRKNLDDSSIKWQYINPAQIYDAPFKSEHGLLLADYHASAVGLAAERKALGQFDDRFARILGQQILKSPKDSTFGYGYKFWPEEAEAMYHTPQFKWMKRTG